MGWDGICVEAHPDYAAMLLDFRRLDCVVARTVHPKALRTTPQHLRGGTLIDRRFRVTDNVLAQQSQQPLSAISSPHACIFRPSA